MPTSFEVRLDFNVDRLAEYVKTSVELELDKPSKSNKSLPKYFKMPNLGMITHPMTILDCHGRILVWQLPDILIGRLVSNAVVFTFIADVYASRRMTYQIPQRFYATCYHTLSISLATTKKDKVVGQSRKFCYPRWCARVCSRLH
jgi:hypothetical protein